MVKGVVGQGRIAQNSALGTLAACSLNRLHQRPCAFNLGDGLRLGKSRSLSAACVSRGRAFVATPTGLDSFRFCLIPEMAAAPGTHPSLWAICALRISQESALLSGCCLRLHLR